MKNLVFYGKRAQAGETLVETLVALLIAALSLTMLAATIMVSANMIRTSKQRLIDYYAKNNELEDITVTAESPTATLQLKEGANEVNSYTVIYVQNDEAPASVRVIAYKER